MVPYGKVGKFGSIHAGEPPWLGNQVHDASLPSGAYGRVGILRSVQAGCFLRFIPASSGIRTVGVSTTTITNLMVPNF